MRQAWLLPPRRGRIRVKLLINSVTPKAMEREEEKEGKGEGRSKRRRKGEGERFESVCKVALYKSIQNKKDESI